MPETEIRWNDDTCTWEIHIRYDAGDYDLPVIFVNGDEAEVSF